MILNSNASFLLAKLRGALFRSLCFPEEKGCSRFLTINSSSSPPVLLFKRSTHSLGNTRPFPVIMPPALPHSDAGKGAFRRAPLLPHVPGSDFPKALADTRSFSGTDGSDLSFCIPPETRRPVRGAAGSTIWRVEPARAIAAPAGPA